MLIFHAIHGIWGGIYLHIIIIIHLWEKIVVKIKRLVGHRSLLWLDHLSGQSRNVAWELFTRLKLVLLGAKHTHWLVWSLVIMGIDCHSFLESAVAHALHLCNLSVISRRKRSISMSLRLAVDLLSEIVILHLTLNKCSYRINLYRRWLLVTILFRQIDILLPEWVLFLCLVKLIFQSKYWLLYQVSCIDRLLLLDLLELLDGFFSNYWVFGTVHLSIWVGFRIMVALSSTQLSFRLRLHLRAYFFTII